MKSLANPYLIIVGPTNELLLPDPMKYVVKSNGSVFIVSLVKLS